jgi:hypothetical protein
MPDEQNAIAARNEIARLIDETLEQLKESLGPWEKAHIANAIAALSWGEGRKPPTDAWLHLAAANVEAAKVPKAERNESYAPVEAQLAALTYEQLRDALRVAHPLRR